MECLLLFNTRVCLAALQGIARESGKKENQTVLTGQISATKLARSIVYLNTYFEEQRQLEHMGVLYLVLE